MTPEIVISLISSIIGGLLVAVVNHFFTRGRTKAETEKLRAEADKIRAEADKIQLEIEKLNSTVEQASLLASGGKEQVVFDGTGGLTGFGLKIHGDYHFKHGILSINARGKSYDFASVQIRQYTYGEKEWEFMPRIESLTGTRKVHLSFVAKVSEDIFRLHANAVTLSGRTLDREKATIDTKDWASFDLYFSTPLSEDCQIELNIDLPEQEATLEIKDFLLKASV